MFFCFGNASVLWVECVWSPRIFFYAIGLSSYALKMITLVLAFFVELLILVDGQNSSNYKNFGDQNHWFYNIVIEKNLTSNWGTWANLALYFVTIEGPKSFNFLSQLVFVPIIWKNISYFSVLGEFYSFRSELVLVFYNLKTSLLYLYFLYLWISFLLWNFVH